MIAKGEQVIIRKPAQKDKEGTILLPAQHEREYAYGRIISVGPKVADVLGADEVKEGDLVLFDHYGERSLEMEVVSDRRPLVVAVHASAVMCTIVEKQLEARKLPIP